jgi:hypothetical protein
MLLSQDMRHLLLGAITCGLLVAPALAELPTGDAQPSFELMKACRPERNKRDAASCAPHGVG